MTTFKQFLEEVKTASAEIPDSKEIPAAFKKQAGPVLSKRDILKNAAKIKMGYKSTFLKKQAESVSASYRQT